MKQHAAAKYSTELRGGRSLITCSLQALQNRKGEWKS